MEYPHASVLLDEVVAYLRPENGGTYLDGTIGAGGHSEKILELGGQKVRVIGLDQDENALEISKKRLEKHGERLVLIRSDYRDLAGALSKAGAKGLDGALLDLGVSSMQLDEPARGFSFKADGPLDMRLGSSGPTAADWLARADRREIERVLYTYGEERYGRRIAEAIVRERSIEPIRTTGRLAAIVSSAVPAAYRHGRIHPATRTFQALRIVVNDELGALKDFLAGVPEHLRPAARVAIISFHSLEDRIVKHAFREWQKQGLGRVLTKKPVVASDAEQDRNARSRSAKLRVFEKDGGGR
ncbi:MAG: Ribosomal RNA small subunit methyltransferase H [Candidatus Omnitrophica bacterium]|nr:Ribosomal RNA small subunit methyltransferase H [Candidatus Omnitrophota bacterium]